MPADTGVCLTNTAGNGNTATTHRGTLRRFQAIPLRGGAVFPAVMATVLYSGTF